MSHYIRSLKNFRMTPEQLYYKSLNQVYNSKNDLIYFENFSSWRDKIQMLNKISNDNCRIIDYTNIMLNCNNSKENEEFYSASFNIIQAFFSELNQNTLIYDTIKRISHDQQENKAIKKFIDILIDDYEKRGGVNNSDQEKNIISNLQILTEQSAQKFSDPLVHDHNEFLIPIEQINSLEEQIRNKIMTLVSKNVMVSNREFAKLKINFRDLISLFTNTRDSSSRKILFKICLNYNRENVFHLVSLLQARSRLANILGFKSYFELQLLSSNSSFKYLKNEGVETKLIQEFLRSIQSKIISEINESLHLIKSEVFRSNTDILDLADLYFYKNKYIQNDHLEGKEFSLSYILEILKKILDKKFNLILDVKDQTLENLNLDLKTLEIHSNKKEKSLIASIILDITFRKTKSNLYQQMYIQSSTNHSFQIEHELKQIPIFYMLCNFKSIPHQQNESLHFSYANVRTLAHELGHCINNLLSSEDFQLVSSTLPIDYAESMASTFETIFLNELSEESFENQSEISTKAEKFVKNLTLLEQLFYAKLDLEFHSINFAEKKVNVNDLIKIYQTVLQDTYGKIENLNVDDYLNDSWFTNIEHLSSYGGMYYSYLIADYFSTDFSLSNKKKSNSNDFNFSELYSKGYLDIYSH